MNRSSVVRRKLVYLGILLALLIPLYLLGQPAGGTGDQGGRLSQMRHRYNMAESDLGEISPTSETMKLATLGLRGVAATLLHEKANDYKVLHEWDRYKATLNNIALLQPHFDRVWEQQAHNLAYNVAIEFDDYRQRYEMIREGSEYLAKGVRQNTHAPRLIWYSGWFYGHKLGVADEKKQYRRLFADDEVLHESLIDQGIAVDSPEARGPLGKPDNWLVGRLWLYRGYDLVDSGIKIRRQEPINFFETGPKWRIKHAEAIEREGILNEAAQNAWQLAADDWQRFGNRSIPTTSSFTVKLDQSDELARQFADAQAEFRELTKEVYADEREQRIEQLTGESKNIMQTPLDELSESQRAERVKLEASMIPSQEEILQKADPAVRLQALNLLAQLRDLYERYLKTEGYRDQINYPYWKMLAQAEQEERTVRARRLVYQAEQANRRAELDRAIQLYEEAFEIWAEIFQDYPILTIDDTAENLYKSIRRYMVLNDTEELAQDFPLTAFVQAMEEEDGQIDPDRYLELQAAFEAEAAERPAEEAAAEEPADEPPANGEASDAEAGNEPTADDAAADQEAADENAVDEEAADEEAVGGDQPRRAEE